MFGLNDDRNAFVRSVDIVLKRESIAVRTRQTNAARAERA